MGGIGRVLVIDDEPVLQDILSTLLRRNGFKPLLAGSATEGLRLLHDEEVDVVLLDLMLPDTPGLDLLPKIQAHDPDLPIIVITAFSSLESAIEAMRQGAFHYVPKPFKNEEVLHIIGQAAERRRLKQENLRLRRRLEGFDEMVGASQSMQEVFQLIDRAAPARSTVLITGESGTGKELTARTLHRLGPRRDGPWVPVPTSATPPEHLESALFGHVKGAFPAAVTGRKGLLEAAHGGTLYLDEVALLSPKTQVKLLGAIQEREFRRVGGLEPIRADVRLVAATSLDLAREVEEGRFREDLYYRLSVITLALPPLRDRAEDIPLLAAHFVRLYAAENRREITALAPATLDALCSYEWPGNVRELENVIERAVVLSRDREIELGALPSPLRSGGRRPAAPVFLPESGLDFRAAVADYQRHLIREALARSGGVQRGAARLLGLSPTTLNEMIRRLRVADEGSSP